MEERVQDAKAQAGEEEQEEERKESVPASARVIEDRRDVRAHVEDGHEREEGEQVAKQARAHVLHAIDAH